jgi:hypothetical protein
MTRLWLQPVFVPVKFYSAIENVDGISTRESEFYPQGVDIPTIDRASQAEYEGSIPFTRSNSTPANNRPLAAVTFADRANM